MKAAFFRQHGGLDVLEIGDLPVPEINDNEVLVNVKAAALNRLDLFVRNGIPGLKLEFPHVGGSDFAGVVAEAGKKATIDVGTPVLVNPGYGCMTCKACVSGEESLCKRFQIYGEHSKGGLAEYVAVRADKVLEYPTDVLSVEEAAAVPLTTLTAYRLLYSKAQVRPGETVVVLGAGSGVSTVAIQLAKLAGCNVIATTSSPEKEKRAYELGADHVINYVETPDWEKEVYQLTNKQGAEVIVDNVGEATWEKSIKAVAKGGRIVTVGATTGPIGKTDIRYVFWKQIAIIGSTMSNQREFLDAMELVFDRKIKPVIARTFELDEVRQAYEFLESGSQFGKVVVRI